MKRKLVEERIVEMLEEGETWLLEARDRLQDKGYDVSWETVWRHLKRMTDEKKIQRVTGERPDYGGHNWQDDSKRPWVYFYRLPKIRGVN